MSRVDLKCGFSCNNACLFCVQGDKRKRYKDKSTDELKAQMDDARKTCDGIVFTGGEVTIRKDLVELVEYAKNVGFSGIQIQSNGRMFSNKKYCEKLINAGANEFSPALHGHIPQLHDYLTRSPGSFLQTAKGIRNLRELGQYIITNSVITRSNYRTLPELASLLVHLGVDQYQLAFVHALGSAQENFKSVVPQKSLIEPYVKKALDIGIRANVSVMTEAIPFCFMRGYEQYVAERIIPQTKIYDADFVMEDYTDFRLNEGKKKGEPCKECAMNHVCEGPWREYPDTFGWSEFVPFESEVPGFEE